MKSIPIILFFSIFFALYGLLNFYIFIRGWQALPPAAPFRAAYVVLFAFLALSFIAGRFLERVWLSPVSEALVWTGSFWLAGMLYFLLAVLFLDLLRTINAVIPVFSLFSGTSYDELKYRTGLAVVGVVVLTVIAGHVNALYPQKVALDLPVQKKVDRPSSFTLVAASDIHLGTIIGRKRFDRIIGQINSLDADIVLLPGDIVDEDLAPVIKENLGERLRTIKSRLGVVAVTGNHEYIGGVEEAVAYLQEHGVIMLRDSVLTLPEGISIIGREDRSIGQMRNGKRKSIDELMVGVDRTRPIILMDHQPFHLEEASSVDGIDLQLSGHTHHGQLWPLNLITNALYEVSWGYKKKGNTHIYVSSGVGSWGPPVRIGNRPEILHIRLTFDGKTPL